MRQQTKQGFVIAGILLLVGTLIGWVAGFALGANLRAGHLPDLAQPQDVSARQVLVSVNTTGDAGQAGGTGNSDEMARGEVAAVYLDYTASISATTDLTLRGKSTPYDTILSLSDYYTDTWVYPRRAVQDYTNTDVTYDGTRKVYEPFVVDGYLTAVITQSTTMTPCVKVYVYWE